MGEKGTLTRRHILDCACPLFIRYGYKAVTMQDICRASGLSKGGLYRHYKDKPSLFSDLLQSFQEDRNQHDGEGMTQVPPPGYFWRIICFPSWETYGTGNRGCTGPFMNSAWNPGIRRIPLSCQSNTQEAKRFFSLCSPMEPKRGNSIRVTPKKLQPLSFL